MNSHRRGDATQDRSWPEAALRAPAERHGPVDVPRRRDLPEPIEVGPGLRLGGASVPVFAGPRRGADAVHVSIAAETRRVAGHSAAAQLASVRDLAPGPLVVSGMTAADAPTVARLADAVLIDVTAALGGGQSGGDALGLVGLGAPPSGLSVLLTGDPEAPVARWRATVQAVRDAGASAVAVVLPAAAAAASTTAAPRLAASIRLATRVPIVIDVGTAATLVGPAVAAGADGIWLSEHADELTVAAARDVVARLAPTVRQVTPGTLPECREAIDRVDAALASLLEYRAGLAASVQQLKPVSGHAGRDAAREAEIVRGMASRAPSLGPDGLRSIVEAIITAGLDAAAREPQPDPPVWRL